MGYNVCMRDCFDTCSLITEMKNGHLVVKANPQNKITSNFLCPKGTLLPKWFHSPERLREPLERVDKKPTKNFKKIDWNHALSITARKIKETRRKYGDKSVLLYYYSGDKGFLNFNFPQRLFNYINASIVEDIICDKSGEEALKDVYGTAYGMDPEDAKNEKLIIYWGINSAWTNLHGIVYMKKLGLEIWDIDVVKSQTAKMSDKFYMIKPETDVLFALGVAKIIIEEDLYDHKFVEKYTFGFDEFASYLKDLKIDYVSKITGIGEREIYEFAREYAEKKGIIHIGYGVQKTKNGGEAVRAISILPALIGKKRGFFYSNRILPRDYVRGTFLRKKEGYHLGQIELAEYIEEGKIKFIFIYGSNPLATLPNQNRLRDAVLNSDVFIVLHDIFFTDTAFFSDIILPSNTFFERFDIADSYYHRYLSINEKITEFCGKSNVEVAKLLAKKLDLDEPALYEDEEELVKKVLSELNISFEELEKRKVLKVPVKSYEPETKSGKIEIYSQRAKNRGLFPFPVYIPLDNEGYEFKLITPTYLMTISSQYHNTYGYYDPFLYMNPSDALERKIKDGDKVRVFNKYGEIITSVKLSKDIQRGIVLLYKAFWPSLLGWNANYLTPEEKNEKYGKGTTLHSVWVNVEKI